MKRPIISIIAAIGKNRELGKDNKLLWNIPEDLKRFRKVTIGHAVIMGQKTYESIGQALPKRENIVLSKDKKFLAKNCRICHSIKEAIDEARKVEKDEVFVIGGGQVYKQFLPMADKLYLTMVDKSFEADTFFPDYSDFEEIKEDGYGERDGLRYRFAVMEKKIRKLKI